MRNVARVMCAASLLAGCSSSGAKDPGPDGGDEGVTLRIATYLSSPDEQAALQAVLDAYHTKYPKNHVDVKALQLSPPQTIAQLTGATPIEGGWDMAIHTFTSVPGVVDVTLDLNTIPALAPLKAKYHPSVVAGMESTGIWAGMPLGIAGFNVAISNQTALTALGVSKPPASLADLVDVCDKYVALGKGAALPVPVGEASDEFGPLVVMAAFLPGSATFGVPSSEATLVQQWRAAVGALKKFADNGCVYLVDDLNGNGSHHDENFDRTINGKNALGVGPVWGLSYFAAQGQIQRGNFGAGPLIGSDAGFIYTVELVTANKATPHAKEVADFLAVVGDPQVQVKYLKARGGTPAAMFTNPSDIGDADLQAAYTAFQTADADHRAGTFPPFTLDLAKAVGPLRDLITGHGDRDTVIETYLCTMTRHPAFAHYASEQECIAAVRAVPAAN